MKRTLPSFIEQLSKQATKVPWMQVPWEELTCVETRPVFGTYRGWLFGFSLTKNLPYKYHLSMSLYPKGRGSLVDDWEFLGKALARWGVPEDRVRLMDEKIRTEPNGVFHYMW